MPKLSIGLLSKSGGDFNWCRDFADISRTCSTPVGRHEDDFDDFHGFAFIENI